MTRQNKNIEMKPLGDAAIIVELGEGISPAVHQRVQSLATLLNKRPFKGFLECVPAYQNLTVYYHPYIVYHAYQECLSPFQKVCVYIHDLVQDMAEDVSWDKNIVTIPVLYGGEYGPDLAHVAEANGLAEEEVIHIHSNNDYLVYMLGFAPGFPFIGGMDERIATPRKATPRQAIASGSVGIAGKQTGVYPLETPGGWQIIGRTPIDLFLPEESPPTHLQAGDSIRFQPISYAAFTQWKEGKQ